jgi:hypothetical protein
MNGITILIHIQFNFPLFWAIFFISELCLFNDEVSGLNFGMDETRMM